MKRMVRSFVVLLMIIFFSAASSCRKESAFSDKTIDTTIPGPSGRLFITIQNPELKKKEKCPMVILLHGIFSNRKTELLTMIANKLQDEGIATIRLDFNGHGESDGEFQDMTVSSEVADAKAVYEYARSLDYVSTISLLGHSQGGVVAGLLAGELGSKKIKDLVLMAPAAILKDHAKTGTTMGHIFSPDTLPEYIEVFGHRIGRDYLLDAQKLPIFESAKKYKGKVLIIQGKKDSVVPFDYAYKYDEKFRNSELILIDSEDHSFEVDTDNTTNLAIDFLVASLIDNKSSKDKKKEKDKEK